MEVEFCKSRSRDMWREMIEVEFESGDDDDTANDEQGKGFRNFEVRVNSLMTDFLKFSVRRRPRRQADDSLCCTCQQGPSASILNIII